MIKGGLYGPHHLDPSSPAEELSPCAVVAARSISPKVTASANSSSMDKLGMVPLPEEFDDLGTPGMLLAIPRVDEKRLNWGADSMRCTKELTSRGGSRPGEARYDGPTALAMPFLFASVLIARSLPTPPSKSPSP